MKYKTKHIAITIVLVVLLGSFFAAYVYSPKIEDEMPEALGLISGIKPSESVKYTILSSEGEPFVGEEKANENGQFKIPLFPSTESEENIFYDLEILQEGKPINLTLKLKPNTRDLSFQARGLGKFSDVVIKNKDKTLNTKTDWAGAFAIDGEDLQKSFEDIQSFQVALFNNNAMSDVRETNPLTIEVLGTAGGGGPDNTGLNQWSVPDCEYNTELSMCRRRRDNVNDNIRTVVNNYVVAIQMMTDELSAVMMQYVTAVGMFFDAKMQLQTQMQLQKMQAQAHKDYHPSEQMCVFGSFVKSVAKVEEKGRFERMAFNKVMMDRYTISRDASGATGAGFDQEARLFKFKTTYCDVRDNNNGLTELCKHTAGTDAGGDDPMRFNRDIDYGRLARQPLTLDINYEDNDLTHDEEDIVALAQNLYWPNTFNVQRPEKMEGKGLDYIEARRIIAMYNIAHNSMAHLISMKASAPEVTLDDNDFEVSGWSFMKALMREFGLSDQDIDLELGARPSYYAQMEVLTKKLYQSPDFYTNLYDKPANVDRIGVSLDAIRLMQMRDRYEASNRLEMLASLLLEAKLSKEVKEMRGEIAESAAAQ